MHESSYNCVGQGKLKGDGSELTQVPGAGWLPELRGEHQLAPPGSELAWALFCSTDSPSVTHSAPVKNKHPVSP